MAQAALPGSLVGAAPTFRTGYILNWKADLVWFLGLPFAAVAIALTCQQWLPAIALASVALWITIPHHFATWARTYGLGEDWRRWKLRLVVGPLVIFAATLAGLVWAPLTIFMMTLLWDHQHSVMQQHGFSRIYDFKAKAGSPATRRFDLMMHFALYGVLIVASPLFGPVWIREFYRWQEGRVDLDPALIIEVVRAIHTISWLALSVCTVIYVGHLLWCWKEGYALNPVKYWFIGASYFLWYFTAWHSDSVLVWGIAHRIMHGVQYIVIVYWYLRRKADLEGSRVGGKRSFGSLLARRGNVKFFLIAGLAYAVVYQLIIGQPLELFGFGVFDFADTYKQIPELGLGQMDGNQSYHIFALMMINSLAFTHYYLDSFIWKVRDTKIQSGL